jgi:hypothetical protein
MPHPSSTASSRRPTAPLPPELAALDDDTLAADLAYVAQERACAADPWTWLATAVTTVDEVDATAPVKPFPTHVCAVCSTYHGGLPTRVCCAAPTRELTYLKVLARQFERGDPPLLLVPKARRMRLTWLFVALHLRLALSRPHARIFFVSSKQEKSGELIERARGILARLPPWAGGHRVTVDEGDPPALRLPETDAALIGVPEGADQLRQYTATAILADEFGTWQWPRLAYAAMRPTIDGGGRLTILSSAYPGTWHEMVSGTFFG